MGAAFSWTSRTWIDGSRPTRSRHVIDNRRGDSINLRHAEKTSIRVDLPPREPLLDQVLQKRRTCVRIERELQIRRCAALARATSRGNLQRNAPGQPGKAVTVGDLLDGVERDYKINGKDHDWVERVLRKHLRPYFGSLRAATLKYEN